MCGCATEREHVSASHSPDQDREFVVGTFERTDVAGVIVEITNTVPRDGGKLILRLRERSGRIITVSVRGPSRYYDPTEQEEELFLGALRVQVGDWVDIQMSSGRVSGFRVIRV